MFNFLLPSKIIKARLPFLFFWIYISTQPGCGSWTGNPPKDDPKNLGTVSLAITGSEASTQLLASSIPIISKSGVQIGSMVISQAKVALKGIKFKQVGGEIGEEETFAGPYAVDLLTNTVTPALNSIQLSSGFYKDIQLQLHKLESEEISDVAKTDPLVNNSIYLTGTYSPNNGSSVNITLKVDVSEEVSLMNPDASSPGVEVKDGSELKVIIAFRMDKWFDFTGREYDFSSLNGTSAVLADAGGETGKKLQEIVKENIKKSAKFGEDADGDGTLGKDEDNDSLD